MPLATMPRTRSGVPSIVPDTQRTTLITLTLCVLAGVLYFLSFLSFDLFPLTWICFVPVLYAIRNSTTKRALLWGWLFGFVTNAGGFYWVVHLISEFGGTPVLVAILGFMVLCAFQGFLMALVIALVRHAD